MKASAEIKTVETITLTMSRIEAEVVNKLCRQVAGSGEYREAADSVSDALYAAGVADLSKVRLQFNVHAGFGGSVRFMGDAQ